MIHDFARTDYHVVNQIAPRIAQVDQLTVFIKDDRSNVSIAKKMAHQYRYCLGIKCVTRTGIPNLTALAMTQFKFGI
jgi:hypothetical protein